MSRIMDFIELGHGFIDLALINLFNIKGLLWQLTQQMGDLARIRYAEDLTPSAPSCR